MRFEGQNSVIVLFYNLFDLMVIKLMMTRDITSIVELPFGGFCLNEI